jgi:hypothetical protein
MLVAVTDDATLAGNVVWTFDSCIYPNVSDETLTELDSDAKYREVSLSYLEQCNIGPRVSHAGQYPALVFLLGTESWPGYAVAHLARR